MRNILSYQNERFTGAEIREWIEYHINNKTEYYKIAYSMRRYLETIYDDREYCINLRPGGTGCGEEKRYKPNLIWDKKKRKPDWIQYDVIYRLNREHEFVMCPKEGKDEQD